MKEMSIRTLLDQHGRRLALKLVAGENGLDERRLINSEVHRPGLALAGFVDLYTYNRAQVLGNTEMLYLNTLPHDEQREALETIYQFDLPCVMVTDGNDALPMMRELSDRYRIPLLTSKFATTKFVHLMNLYLDDFFASQVRIHGSLVDVYGVGLLFTGQSGIGKSEIALDLVERGHRLVSDDIVTVTRKAQGILVGSGEEMFRNHMELRGVGIVDVRSMFGIRAIRLRKRIEVEVHLVVWDESFDYERIGLEDRMSLILDVEIPVVTLPIYPGKNITVISEVIALNHLLKIHGYHPAKDFNRQLMERMRRKSQ